MPDKPLVFVAHDFSNPKRLKTYRKAVEKAFKGSGYSPLYGTKESLMQKGEIPPNKKSEFFNDIIRGIKKSKFIIADLTSYKTRKISLNLNVVLELGIAYGADKTSELICHAGIYKQARKHLTNLGGKTLQPYKNTKTLEEAMKIHLKGFTASQKARKT